MAMCRVPNVYQVVFVQLVTTMFMFVKSDISIQEFYHEERDALIPFRDSMKSSFNLHGNWTGPPCRNNMSRWVGIVCSNSHITDLTLESINLTGSLPVGFLENITFLSKLSFHNNSITGNLPNLENLMYLESIFLSGNQFSGPIPWNYINLTKLDTLQLQENNLMGEIPPLDQASLSGLNLSYNRLFGQIPKTKVVQKFPSSSFDHNLGLCGTPLDIPCPVSPSPESPKDKKKLLKVSSIVLISVAAAILVFFVILVLFCCYKRSQIRNSLMNILGVVR